jgi:mannose/fructose/N-acetylgalactosamine-specific phosphotransferase system component IIB
MQKDYKMSRRFVNPIKVDHGSIKISDYSRKLALRKEEKERKIIAEILSSEKKLNDSSQNSDEINDIVDGEINQQHHTKMIARGILIEQKKINMAEEIKIKELDGCTFKPKINNTFSASFQRKINRLNNFDFSDQRELNESVNTNNSTISVFKRLYGSPKRRSPSPPPPPPLPPTPPPSTKPTFLKNKPPKSSIKGIEGYNKSIKRIRAVNEEKLKLKEEAENEWKVVDEKYRKSRELSLQGFAPFEFQLDDRFNGKQKTSVKKKRPR